MKKLINDIDKFNTSCIKIAMKNTLRKRWLDLIFAILVSIWWKTTLGYWNIIIPCEIVSIVNTFIKEYKQTKKLLNEVRPYYNKK